MTITLAVVIPRQQVQNILNPIGALFNPVDVVFGLGDSIQVDASGGYGIGQPGETATIDAFDPFQITSMEVVDSNGVVIPYFDFTTIDGFTIPSTQPPVVGAAEPATLALVGMRLGLLVAARRMRSQSPIGLVTGRAGRVPGRMERVRRGDSYASHRLPAGLEPTPSVA